MRYSLAQNATMTKVHLCSKMTPVDSCGIFLLLDICFVVLLSLLYLPTSLCPDTMPRLIKILLSKYSIHIYIYIPIGLNQIAALLLWLLQLPNRRPSDWRPLWLVAVENLSEKMQTRRIPRHSVRKRQEWRNRIGDEAGRSRTDWSVYQTCFYCTGFLAHFFSNATRLCLALECRSIMRPIRAWYEQYEHIQLRSIQHVCAVA